MKTTEIKVTRIGNSRGVRLPAATLRRYRIGSTVAMEEKAEGIFLRPTESSTEKSSWEETALAMAAECETWDDWDVAAGDGLESVPWESARTRKMAEKPAPYGTRPQRGRAR